MIIDATILCLIATDQSKHRLGKYRELDNHVHQDLDKTTYEPLKQVFTRVIHYDFLKRYVDIGARGMNQEIIDIVKTERPKYVLWSSMSYEIQETTFQKVRSEGATIIGWFYDDEFRFEDYSKWWLPYLDYVLTCDRESVHKYRELGAFSQFFPVYSNPDYFKRLNLPRKYDVSFVGTRLADRASLVDELKTRNIQVHTFGKGWDAGYMSFDEMVNIYNTSKITLTFTKAYGAHTRPQIKGKVFEICMCGGFLLCEYVPGIEDVYTIDKEIVCFKDIAEAADKIKYYLSHDTEREAIARAGWERAHRDLTMANRLSVVFQEIEKGADKGKAAPNLPEMPPEIRRRFAAYYLGWARARVLEGYRDLWKDELDLASAYGLNSREVRYLYTVGRFPSPVRPWLIRLYQALGRFSQMLRWRIQL